MDYCEVGQCRVCHAGLEAVLDLGMQNLGGQFPAVGEQDPPSAPLKLMRCVGCGLAQLAHTVSPELMFRSYGYRSGVTETMRGHLHRLADEAWWMLPERHLDTRVLDIGGNDGTLLAHIPLPQINKYLIDPSDVPSLHGYDYGIRRKGFFPQDMPADWMAFDLIFTVACFYDADDPVAFAQAVAARLAPDGLWCVEVADARKMAREGGWDAICLPPDDPVATFDGLRPISSVKVGDLVMTHNGRYRAVEKVYERFHDGDLIELRAYGFGHTLRVTPNHPVMVKGRDGWSWVEARRVCVGDVVGRPILEEVEDVEEIFHANQEGRWGEATMKMYRVPFGDDMMKVMGWYLAEGCVTDAQLLFYFGTSTEEIRLAEECRDTIKRLGFVATIRTPRTSTCVAASVILGRILEDHLGKGAAGKRIKPSIMKLPRRKLEALFLAYMQGDGYRYRDDQYLRASTVSENLAYDVAAVANRIGYKCCITKQARPLTCEIEGRIVNQQPLWDILVHLNPAKRMKCWLEGGYQCGRVRMATRTTYKGMVHNIAVEGDQTYVSPAMTVHNCHEHVCYYDARTLQRACNRAGLVIKYGEANDCNGGSIRFYLTHGDPISWQGESIPTTASEWIDFASHVERSRNEIADFLFKSKPGKVHLLGASTKANTWLQAVGANAAVIQAASDRDRRKVGRRTPGTGIPIVSEEESRQMRPDVYLIGPWPFRNELIERERDFLCGGGKLVFPMPKLQVVGPEHW